LILPFYSNVEREDFKMTDEEFSNQILTFRSWCNTLKTSLAEVRRRENAHMR
jgi:hypothetical protein